LSWLIPQFIKLYERVSFIVGIDNRKASVGPASAEHGHVGSPLRFVSEVTAGSHAIGKRLPTSRQALW
jgi:hypothetical protein